MTRKRCIYEDNVYSLYIIHLNVSSFFRILSFKDSMISVVVI